MKKQGVAMRLASFAGLASMDSAAQSAEIEETYTQSSIFQLFLCLLHKLLLIHFHQFL
jgi:hypothetical protein